MTGAAPTTTSWALVLPLKVVTRIRATPSPTAVITPAASTATTAGFSLVKVIWLAVRLGRV